MFFVLQVLERHGCNIAFDFHLHSHFKNYTTKSTSVCLDKKEEHDIFANKLFSGLHGKTLRISSVSVSIYLTLYM